MHTLNCTYLPEIIEKLFYNTKPSIIFCDGDEYEKVRLSTAKLDVLIVTMRKHPAGGLSIQEVLKTPAEEGFKPTPLKQGFTQALAIISNPGTTGTPKAVIVSNYRTILSGFTCSVYVQQLGLDFVSVDSNLFGSLQHNAHSV
ncbi:uncharacterized protein [Drosophila takahashii]|uniref:uncharacterized protein isoform X2 n=1 Tax=Drosophila takahashii TaxID=29030 RepID=UPI0038995F4B